MLTRPQQILLKRAQAEAGIADAEYRAALALVSGLPGCNSSKDARLMDEHLDAFLSYFEAIYWRKVDTEDWHLHGSCNGIADVFKRRGFWAQRNQRGSTSRDRFVASEYQEAVQHLEQRLAELGYGFAYCRAIQNRIVPFNLVKYRAALARTIKSKLKSKPVLAAVSH